MAPVDEPTAMSFTVPLSGSTIVTTAAVVITYSTSACYTDSATPMCSGSICIAMSCGGGSFTPDGTYDSLWDSVKPITGVRKCCPGVYLRLALVVSASVLHPTWQCLTSEHDDAQTL